jgi:hypothetical protein
MTVGVDARAAVSGVDVGSCDFVGGHVRVEGGDGRGSVGDVGEGSGIRCAFVDVDEGCGGCQGNECEAECKEEHCD